jgi:hypothetical protein
MPKVTKINFTIFCAVECKSHLYMLILTVHNFKRQLQFIKTLLHESWKVWFLESPSKSMKVDQMVQVSLSWYYYFCSWINETAGKKGRKEKGEEKEKEGEKEIRGQKQWNKREISRDRENWKKEKREEKERERECDWVCTYKLPFQRHGK